MRKLLYWTFTGGQSSGPAGIRRNWEDVVQRGVGQESGIDDPIEKFADGR